MTICWNNEHSLSYGIRCHALKITKEKVEAGFANLRRTKSISDQRYEQVVQLCTDKGFARDNVTSKRSSASSIARKHELIALQLKHGFKCRPRTSASRNGRMLNFDDERSKFNRSKHGPWLEWSCWSYVGIGSYKVEAQRTITAAWGCGQKQRKWALLQQERQ